MAVRFAWFLTSLAAATGTGKGKTRLDVGTVAAQVAAALADRAGAPALASALATALPAAPTPGAPPLPPAEAAAAAAARRAFWAANVSAMLDVLQAELASIQAGEYAYPYDLTPLGAPDQWSPLAATTMARAYMADQAVVSARRAAGNSAEVAGQVDEKDRGVYPEYYLQNFHFQTGGWLTAESAALYDYQVETLFLGLADAMRRRALPAISRHVAHHVTDHVTDHVMGHVMGAKGAGLRLLDVGTGTGRFLSFVKHSFPGLHTTALDLSPFYLARAREATRQFESLPGAGPSDVCESNAESMPLDSESMDVVTCVYLFHELPPTARAAVAAEMARVAKPGGLVVFVDSAQSGDSTVSPASLSLFAGRFHEPYYESYLTTDLVGLFESVGLTHVDTSLAWASKVMAFHKPRGGASAVSVQAEVVASAEPAAAGGRADVAPSL